MENLGEGAPQITNLLTGTPPDDGNPQISVSECAHPLTSFDVHTSAGLPCYQDTSTCMSSDSPQSVLSSSVQQAHWSSLSCEGYERVGKSVQEEYPESEKKLLHTSAVQDYQTEMEMEVLQTRMTLQPDMNTIVPPESSQCYLQEGTTSKPTNPNKDSCDQKAITSEYSFGEQILKAWTDGIMTISANPKPELREKSRAAASPKASKNVEALLPNESTLVECSVELPQAEHGSDVTSTVPADVEVPPESLPPVLLRPSRMVFACEEREEQLLQDSDSELEMTPGCELQLQVSDSHTHDHICSEEAESTPPGKKENLELPVEDIHSTPSPPPPPPPPPMFQHSPSKRDTMLCPCTDSTSMVEPPTVKCGGGFGLQSFFRSRSIQLVRPLHSMTFGPLGTLKLTQRLKSGVQSISANVCTQLQPQPKEFIGGIWDTSNERSCQDSPPEPPSKRPRLFANGVIPGPMGDGNMPCDNLMCAVTEEYTCGIEMYPLSGSRHPNRHQNFISNTEQLLQNPTPEATVPIMTLSPEAEVNMISQFQPEKLEYPHQPTDSADDGQDTMYQAVPTECARSHALVPNIVPCGNESEDRKDDDDDTNGGNELEVPVDQQILSYNSQASKHLLDDGEMAVSEVPYLDEQEVQLSSPEMSLVPKVALTLTEASPAPMYTYVSGHSTESAPSLPTVHNHQLVPDDPLNSSFTIHSLYEQPEAAVKEQKADLKLCSSLEDVDIDELDGPTVLAMALKSIETRHKTVSKESPEEVPLHHWSSAYASCQMSSGVSAANNLPGSTSEVVQTTHLNLTRPKLRLGLSRRQKCKPLHPTH